MTSSALRRGLLKGGAVVALFVLLFATGWLDLSALSAVTRRPGPFLAGFGFLLVSFTLMGVRLRITLAPLAPDLTVGEALRLTYTGLFFGAIAFGTVSGDLMKVWLLTRNRRGKTALITGALYDKVIGLYGMIMTAALPAGLYLLFHGGADDALTAVMGATLLLFGGVTVGGAILLLSPTVARRLLARLSPAGKLAALAGKIFDALDLYRTRPGVSLMALALSLTNHLLSALGVLCLTLLLDDGGPDLLLYFFLIPVALTINAIPLAPGGLGVGETGFHYMYHLAGSATGAEVAILFHVIYMILALGGGGLAYLWLGRPTPPKEPQG